jgi:opacity protein-like surface antigen
MTGWTGRVLLFGLLLGCHWGSASPLLEPPAPGGGFGQSLERGMRFTGAGVGVGIGTRQYGGQQYHDLAFVQIHHGRVISDEWAPDRWYGGHVLLSAEASFGYQYHPASASLAGLTPMVRYVFSVDGKWHPYLQGGVGVLWTDIGEPDLGGEFQFGPQGGVGGVRFVRPQWALKAEYRFIHHSNGGIRSPNGGVNLHGFLLGLSRVH